MSFFSRIMEFLGKEAGPAETFDEPVKPLKPAENIQPSPATGKYAAIRGAVEGRLEHLLRREIPEHRELADEDSLELHYVEIEATTPEGQALLDEFFAEFNPASRQIWIRKFIGMNAAVKMDVFAGVFGQADLPPTDQLDPRLQILNLGSPANYQVRLWSQWVQIAKPNPQSVVNVRGNPVILRIHDRLGIHAEVRRENYPIKLGRVGEVAVEGSYASADHCCLNWINGQVVVEDHSRNGTWLDGAKLHHQSQPIPLGTHLLKLGKGQGDVKDWPEIELEILPETVTPIAETTPIARDQSTPIAGEAPSLLAVLSIQDSTGNPQRDVLRLPFSIGRGSERDYVTPSIHAGVSGLHLVIEAITGQGAEVTNAAHAKNGTALNGVLQGERFLWPFDEELVLAPLWKHAEPVRLTLKRL